jgi:hypothetical protein
MIIQGYTRTYMFVTFEVILGDQDECNLYVNIASYGINVLLIHGCLYKTPSSFSIAVQRMRDDTARIVDIIF